MHEHPTFLGGSHITIVPQESAPATLIVHTCVKISIVIISYNSRMITHLGRNISSLLRYTCLVHGNVDGISGDVVMWSE